MSRKDGQKVVQNIAVSPGNLAFVARMCGAMSKPGFDAAKSKDALRAPVLSAIKDAKAALDKANASHNDAEQQGRILEKMLSGLLLDGPGTLDAWREACGEDKDKDSKKGDKKAA